MRLVVIMLALVPIFGYRSLAPRPAETVEEVWSLTLPDAIRLGLEHAMDDEVCHSIQLGPHGIPLGGFEPTPGMNGTLSAVYDPDIPRK